TAECAEAVMESKHFFASRMSAPPMAPSRRARSASRTWDLEDLRAITLPDFFNQRVARQRAVVQLREALNSHPAVGEECVPGLVDVLQRERLAAHRKLADHPVMNGAAPDFSVQCGCHD